MVTTIQECYMTPSSIWNIRNDERNSYSEETLDLILDYPNDERNSYSEEPLDIILDTHLTGNTQTEFVIRTCSCNVVQKSQVLNEIALRSRCLLWCFWAAKERPFNSVKYRAICALGVDMRNLLTKIYISASLVSIDLHTFFNSVTHQMGPILSLENMGLKV